jgi:peptidoglycan/LPS O-acetylase OafA/YrhL
MLAGSLKYPFNFLFSPHNTLFLFGMGAALISRKVAHTGAIAAIVIGVVVFFGVGFSEVLGGVRWNPDLRTVAYGLGATAAVAGLASGSVRAPRWLRFLGDASYSIYLVHSVAMAVIVVILKAVGAPWSAPPLVMLLVIAGLGVCTGVIVHLAIEKPVLAALGRYTGRPKSQVGVPAPSAEARG